MLPLCVHNETSRLRSVFLGTPESSGGVPEPGECYDPNSLQHVLKGTYPTESAMLREMDALARVFHRYDITVYRPEVIENYNQIFARDIAFVIGDKLIKSNILPDRALEFKAMGFLLDQMPKESIITLPEDCHVEGGDVILADDHIFIGIYAHDDYPDYITARTNVHAARAIQALFPNKTVKTFELRKSNTNPLENALHLDCCFQPIGRGHALLHKNGFLNPDDYHWLVNRYGTGQVFEATKQEMTQMNCNTFSISEDVIVSETQFRRLNAWLRSRGFTVEEVPYAEISKQGGLLRCSTLPLTRD